MQLKLVYRFLRKILDWMVDGFYSEVYLEAQQHVTEDLSSCVFILNISSGYRGISNSYNASDCDNANAILDSVSTHYYYEIIDIATPGESSPPLLSQTNDSLSAYEQPQRFLADGASHFGPNQPCSLALSLEPSFRPLGQFLSDGISTIEL